MKKEKILNAFGKKGTKPDICLEHNIAYYVKERTYVNIK